LTRELASLVCRSP